jgi:hypothetical protein
MKHPIQKTKIDKSGVLRFVQNDVVDLMMKLLKKHGIGLNELHEEGYKISQGDWDQFNQLIGYSVSGAPIADAIKDIAEDQHKLGRTVLELRAERAEKLLRDARLALRDGLADLYEIHPSSLMEEEPKDADDLASNVNDHRASAGENQS